MSKKKSLKVPGKDPPSLFPQQGLYGERCSVSTAIGLFIHLYLSESPKQNPPTKCGENIVTVHGDSSGRKAYIKWGAAWFLKGIVNDTASTTRVLCNFSMIPSPDHPPFLGRPEPR